MPDHLATKPKILWRTALGGKGLGGVAANSDYVIASGRDLADLTDVYRCLKANSGEEVWTIRHPAPGKLDFGSSPRATPLIHEGQVFLYNAFGNLKCVNLQTGEIIWEKELKDEFPTKEDPTWGYCASPLVVAGKLILNVPGAEVTLIALDPKTGKLFWKGSGDGTGYGSFIVADLGGKRQLIGHDRTTLGGWDIDTGKRLWTIKPNNADDFNVPTPIASKDSLVVSTENNGTRQFRFTNGGVANPTPVGRYRALKPDTHSPVAVGNRLFGVSGGRLHCLDLANNLNFIWEGDDALFGEYTALIASDHRLLAVGHDSELLLIDATADTFKPMGRMKVIEDESGIYAHPAMVGHRMYFRSNDAVLCLDLSAN